MVFVTLFLGCCYIFGIFLADGRQAADGLAGGRVGRRPCRQAGRRRAAADGPAIPTPCKNYAKNEKMREFDNYNKTAFLNFTVYLPNLVYLVAFVSGITFTTHLWNVDFIVFLTCWGKSAVKSGLRFLKSTFCRTCHSSLFRRNPYTRMCVLTIGSFSFFRKKCENT